MITALIGHGYWGRILEWYLKVDERYQLKCVCDSKSNLDTVWNDKEVEAVVVATRNEQRFTIVKQALLNLKHVLTEKPLAMTALEAKELSYYAKGCGLSLVVDYTFTVSKALRSATLLIDEGRIGKLLGFDMRLDHLAPFGGGDVYWILGSHCLSVLDMFIPLERLSFSRKDIVVVDGVTETGVIQTNMGQIHLSLNYPSKALEFVFYGSGGTIVYNPLEVNSLRITDYKKPIWVREVPQRHEYYQIDESDNLRFMTEYFYDVINGKQKGNLDTAIKITEILEQIHGNSQAS